MKLNPVTSLIAIIFCALIAYGFHSFTDNAHKDVITYGSFFMLSFIMLFIIGKRYSSFHTAANLRVVSIMFLAAAFISNLLFSFISFTIPAYIVVHGLLLLIYLLIVYFLSGRKR